MTITRKFRSVGWVATVACAALSCYLISYRVSAERIALENVEAEITEAQRDILALNTEFETRSRMSQLERWNRADFALVAPGARQYLAGEVELASLFSDESIASPAEAVVRQASMRTVKDDDRAAPARDFEAPRRDDLDTPRIQQASYLVPEQAGRRRHAERIAFLDDRLRGDIATRAAGEQEGSED